MVYFPQKGMKHMTDNENRKPTAKATSPKKEKSSESVLNEFGAAEKKAASQSSKKAAPATEKKEERTAPPTAPAPKKAPSSEAAPKKDKPSPEQKTVTERAKEERKEEKKADEKKPTEKKTKAPQAPLANATTASPKKEKPVAKENKKIAEKEQPDLMPRSAKPAHRVIPYVLLVLTVFVGVSLILNLICNQNNVLQSNPSAHWMGIVGYYVCYALFGLFGPAILDRKSVV